MAAAALYSDNSKSATCMTNRPRAILEAHGTNDSIIPFEEKHRDPNIFTPNTTQWTGWWAERNEENGCGSDADPNIASTCWGTNPTYPCNGTRGFIQQYTVDNLVHCWPSKVDNTDSQEHGAACLVGTLDYTNFVLEFFANWHK